jgi:prevent-host-death family protein
MRTVGLFEAKQKLSELLERAREGEKMGITRRGELAAVLVPVPAAPEIPLAITKTIRFLALPLSPGSPYPLARMIGVWLFAKSFL